MQVAGQVGHQVRDEVRALHTDRTTVAGTQAHDSDDLRTVRQVERLGHLLARLDDLDLEQPRAGDHAHLFHLGGEGAHRSGPPGQFDVADEGALPPATDDQPPAGKGGQCLANRSD